MPKKEDDDPLIRLNNRITIALFISLVLLIILPPLVMYFR